MEEERRGREEEKKKVEEIERKRQAEKKELEERLVRMEKELEQMKKEGVQTPPPSSLPPPAATTPPKTRRKVAYTFDDSDPDYAQAKEGEEVEILEPEQDGWVKVKTSEGKVGFFPENYLSEEVTADTPPPAKLIVLQKKVQSTFQAKEPGEITLNEGDIVKVVGANHGEWTFCEDSTGKMGIVPSKYLVDV